ncbi:asparagine synthase, glutamine-hydrolyzing [Campylobacter sputorum subsp. bubulus]|uniref:Asparagine synthase, glutamine-hydrolyzing n=1 Tax=Campylobacter sputorum subsp. sputorum TaxID=32024 RepID=A0A381DLH0_9BACT|nr:cation transporter [Campylobacter sputorum]ASM34805.1 heavy-metal-associated domain protein, putative copper metallochaperone CopZ [Campylobacter sputorum aubsp. sputorum RM3237]ASM36469.1 heavy-metal-associated domain protein, putative copper metallochaperone CopZ [Campylobacter sputorum bv. faecalis CCUG 20703]ASM38164.1 heavy-metal-associated domain protein, putative copper metallochaperone CopZ [Campylobacter sputorum bv. paraureolyticus LMG 11764]KAB0581639.1 heavy metal transport/detox
MRKFELENVKCNNCANLVKNALRDDFGEVEVDVENKTIVLDVKNKEKLLFETLKDIGFPIIKEI